MIDLCHNGILISNNDNNFELLEKLRCTSIASKKYVLLPFTSYMPFHTFVNRADPDQGLLCLLMEI